MSFVPFIPCDALKPYIERFVISEGSSESVYKVVPGAGVVMGFQFQGKLYHFQDGKEVLLSQSGVTGIIDSYRVFKSSKDIKTVLVFFKDGGASAFFRDPIHELFQSSVSLDNFFLRSELLLFEEQLCDATTHLDKIRIVERFLLARMKVQKPDLIVSRAHNLIYQSRGSIQIIDLCQQLNISQSPLEKRFRKVIGASPKKFATIVRFKNIIHDSIHSPSLTALAYESGFYDQSHFIKEFKGFTGDTPKKYLNLE